MLPWGNLTQDNQQTEHRSPARWWSFRSLLPLTVSPPIDWKVWRAYGWRTLTVGRLCHAFRLLVACSNSWQVDALIRKLRRQPYERTSAQDCGRMHRFVRGHPGE